MEVGIGKFGKDFTSRVKDYHTMRTSYFQHGVASGDPLPHRVIIWTRVTPDESGEITVEWEMSSSPDLTKERTGKTTTGPEHDYTVKVDVDGLEPATSYFYRFRYQKVESPIGRTKTAPRESDISRVRFGLVTCNHIQNGSLIPFTYLAQRDDLDFIVHTGDSIYEYGPQHNDTLVPYPETPLTPGRVYWRPIHEPPSDCVTLDDYRQRYGQYYKDSNYQRLNQRHPWFYIWDDHESADGAWREGATNHDEKTQGPWITRFNHAKKAWFEWHPVRGTKIYRQYNYGSLLSLFFLDTRSYRDKAPGIFLYQSRENRTLLGPFQKDWLKERLLSLDSRWKFIVTSVTFSRFFLLPSLRFLKFLPTLSVLSDGWEGYLNERQEILDFVSINDIKNVVFLSGDVHMTILSHVKDEKGRTGAVEYTTPSISSDNLDELLGDYNSSNVWITRLLSRYFKSINPHIVKLDTTNHGYLILEVSPDRVQGDVWFISDPRSPSASMEYAFSAVTSRGEPQLTLTSSPLV